MRTIQLLAVSLAATVALAACGGAPPSPPVSPSAPPPAGLDGRTFLSTGITGHVLVAGSQIRLAFQGGTIGINAGCNSISGAYDVVDGRMRTSAMATTEMACDEPLMAQDQWVSAFIPGSGVTLDGDTLTLDKDGVTLTFTDRVVADPDRPLLGTRWVLDSIVSGEMVSSVPGGVTASLTFADGRVDVEAGCNRGGGAVTTTDTTVAFEPIALTKMGCPGPAMAGEQAFTAVLQGVVAYRIEAGTLMLEAGGKGLVLRAMP